MYLRQLEDLRGEKHDQNEKKEKERLQNHANWLFAYHYMKIEYLLQHYLTIKPQTALFRISCI